MVKRLLGFLLILLLALLQSTVLKINLLLLLVLFPASYAWAFWGGLILDFLTSQRLGLSSLLFLIIVHVFKLYSRKYETRPSFLLPFVFLASWVFAQAEKLNWALSQGLFLMLTAWFISTRFSQEKQLKLDL